MKKNRIIGLLATFLFCINFSFAQVTKEAQTFYDQGLVLKEQKK